MRITRFTAENFKRLKAIDITPDANTVVLAGRNAQGKSSVLDGIMAALAGKAGSKELVRPIRDGESKATVVVELDDLRIERKWTPGGSTVVVGPKDGASKLNSPQAVLDKLIGSLSFDPLAFAEAPAKQQVETLIDLVGRERFDEIAEQRRTAYDERTDVNRELKRVRTQYEALGTPQAIEKIDVGRLTDEIGDARTKASLREQWEAIDLEINALRSKQDDLSARAAAIQVDDSELPAMLERLDAAEDINLQVFEHARWVELGLQVQDADHASEELTKVIEECDKAKQFLIENAELPVEGLTFDDEGVEYNGVPFVQASAAERLKVSVAMAMSLNPELKVISIRDASLLDDESRQTLVDMAVEHDFQLWIEVVGEGGEIGIIIEDGQVQS